MNHHSSAATDPASIARHPLLTAREKAELLLRMRAAVTGALENDLEVGLSPGEIDAAMEELRQEIEEGRGSETGMAPVPGRTH